MVIVELQRRNDAGQGETKRFGPFQQVSYEGLEGAQLVCDGKEYFRFDQMFGAIVLRFDIEGEPDIWDRATVTSV